MFWFLAFYITSAVIPPNQALDELVLGEWTIQSSTFSPKTPSRTKIIFYSVIFTELPEARTFEGVLLCNKTSMKDFSLPLKIIFTNPEDNTQVSIYSNTEDLVADLKIETTFNGLKIASGKLNNMDYTYSLSLFSYKAAELTLYNHESSEVTICKMYRTVSEPKGDDSSSFFSTFMPMVMLAAYFMTKNKNTQVVNNNAEGNNDNENNNEEEQQEETNEETNKSQEGKEEHEKVQ